ncbi:esterase/lipase family protein [Legionella sp. CNM-4043-24]|uniref:esterase/lipase family protein n=1 Tax=Legionella sp. CNM-4043-24 TaxID=3421646 RepID=UPI00403ACD05
MITKPFDMKRIYIQLLMLFIGLGFGCQTLAFDQNKIRNTSLVVQMQQRELIVLIHGLVRSSASMRPLQRWLEKQGYTVFLYSYPSTRYTIQEHGARLNQYIQETLAKNPGIKIHFITHSLGGIIAREALFSLSDRQLKHIGSLIMLSPPNRGSFLAKLTVTLFPMIRPIIKPLAELSDAPSSYVHQVPVPRVNIGIIAGRYDAKVPPASAQLTGQNSPVIINTNHTFIMNNSQTRQLIIHFLQHGRFTEQPDALRAESAQEHPEALFPTRSG